ncbi:MRPL7 (YDR237W) [Zygosaccharomyces parabailii]|uniref:Large ribosomal subunit protein uL5m n=1 Tax=Zygosaccharomyces bailii (strain CLIB 213 / ATCC 58445 / CBS 680 / BCRC 21525 / NBRC 1098 / NCYC 1416 / NRRL Y-2227) TaxID=1333698 RepID=A0A8J2T3P1_ZYGB2|nr:MRPL7 (YDR237W) [Zygosaccharomyces parabailii]CDF87804.1 BN860_14862g1_1 [Zygosaccharomyces bailii CLIB 213]CDH17864.1 probable 54S ribosomal protein L7, mitochondrial [Zygosaccharomyces bailii ISA1307]SJM83580.1 probable 54S ribosomal protein L7, mitochondrial [Zygosaccharomyces bailii]
MQIFILTRRSFSCATMPGKAACSLVKPIHHRVKIDKARLSPRFPELQLPKNDVRSPAFNPVATHQDRVYDHYANTLQSDVLLINYSHGAETELGLKQRNWDGSSPYHINRPPRKPKGSSSQLPDIHPIKWHNIPEITSVVLNCYVREAKENRLLAITAALQLQQITGCKPHPIYSKNDVPSWKLRRGNQMGAKVELKGRPMSQFLSVLTEIVMPRIREYKGISNKSGNGLGSLSFGLTSEDVKFFPEIDSNQDLWPKTFGMHININTSAQTDVQARTLISGFQIPFHGIEKKKH